MKRFREFCSDLSDEKHQKIVKNCKQDFDSSIRFSKHNSMENFSYSSSLW